MYTLNCKKGLKVLFSSAFVFVFVCFSCKISTAADKVGDGDFSAYSRKATSYSRTKGARASQAEQSSVYSRKLRNTFSDEKDQEESSSGSGYRERTNGRSSNDYRPYVPYSQQRQQIQLQAQQPILPPPPPTIQPQQITPQQQLGGISAGQIFSQQRQSLGDRLRIGEPKTYIATSIGFPSKVTGESVDLENKYSDGSDQENFRVRAKNSQAKVSNIQNVSIGRDSANGIRTEVSWYRFDIKNKNSATLTQNPNYKFFNNSYSCNGSQCTDVTDKGYFDFKADYYEGAFFVEFARISVVNFYTGAGLGLAKFKFSNANIKNSSYKIAYSGSLGANIVLHENLTAFVGYKFVALNGKFNKNKPVQELSTPQRLSDGRTLTYNDIDISYNVSMVQVGLRLTF